MSWLRQTYYTLPPRSRRWARRIFYLPRDFWDRLRGKHQGYPPRGMIFTGPGDFKATGDRFLQHFIELGQLAPDGQVLDVGSGIGRMAIPLTGYLKAEGGYQGFDPVEEGVRWCQRNISPSHPNFRFTQVALENDLYTAAGASASQFRFPYPDQSFDLIILTSVFTHMLPEEVENYLREIHRTMKTGGRCLATFFILNPEGRSYMAGHPGGFQFPHQYDHYSLLDAKVKAANVAFEEDYLHQQFEENGLSRVGTYYGYWTGRPKAGCLEFQDLVVLERRTSSGIEEYHQV